MKKLLTVIMSIFFLTINISWANKSIIIIDIADHVLVIGKVENLSINENKEPLIYYRSQYREVK
jgi:hypothetical protein